uniref:Uncharacterized protein n=1 Tax=Ditylenchus dipsaci TaxID=166011 RepID=A0A915CRG4_9BILA
MSAPPPYNHQQPYPQANMAISQQQQGGYGYPQPQSQGYPPSKDILSNKVIHNLSSKDMVTLNNSPSCDEIVSAIFNFDPVNPTSDGAGFEHYEQYQKEGGYGSDKKQTKEYSNDAGYGKSAGYGADKGYGYNKSAFQCVCCAPKTSTTTTTRND